MQDKWQNADINVSLYWLDFLAPPLQNGLPGLCHSISEPCSIIFLSGHGLMVYQLSTHINSISMILYTCSNLLSPIPTLMVKHIERCFNHYHDHITYQISFILDSLLINVALRRVQEKGFRKKRKNCAASQIEMYQEVPR